MKILLPLFLLALLPLLFMFIFLNIVIVLLPQRFKKMMNSNAQDLHFHQTSWEEDFILFDEPSK